MTASTIRCIRSFIGIAFAHTNGVDFLPALRWVVSARRLKLGGTTRAGSRVAILPPSGLLSAEVDTPSDLCPHAPSPRASRKRRRLLSNAVARRAVAAFARLPVSRSDTREP